MDQNCGIWASSGMKPGACEKASRTGPSPTARRMPDITARSLKQSVKNCARFGASYLRTIPVNLLGEHLYLAEAGGRQHMIIMLQMQFLGVDTGTTYLLKLSIRSSSLKGYMCCTRNPFGIGLTVAYEQRPLHCPHVSVTGVNEALAYKSLSSIGGNRLGPLLGPRRTLRILGWYMIRMELGSRK